MTSSTRKPPAPLFLALGMGLVAATLFSSTFVLNTWMSEAGGHWYWTAALRYIYVFIILSFYLTIRGRLGASTRFIRAAPRFWILSGTIGFAAFYLLLSYASTRSPGWIVATTWQFTVVASIAVLRLFGGKVRALSTIASAMVFVGVVLTNSSHFGTLTSSMFVAALPVIVAAFCYPLGNQLLLAATNPSRHIPRVKSRWIPDLREAGNDTFANVWLMTAGALPALLLAGLVVDPPLPTKTQLTTTFFIAIFTGVLGTAALQKGRSMAGIDSPAGVAAVDATQAMEVPLALVVECLWFGGVWPAPVGVGGILMIVAGLCIPTMIDARDHKQASAAP
jgi:drug/metabolite transporter (DMT)-like permease